MTKAQRQKLIDDECAFWDRIYQNNGHTKEHNDKHKAELREAAENRTDEEWEEIAKEQEAAPHKTEMGCFITLKMFGGWGEVDGRRNPKEVAQEMLLSLLSGDEHWEAFWHQSVNVALEYTGSATEGEDRKNHKQETLTFNFAVKDKKMVS